MKKQTNIHMPSSADGMGRIDGRLKVTGAAKYSAEYAVEGLTYGVLVGSTITRAAESAPGVFKPDGCKGHGRDSFN